MTSATRQQVASRQEAETASMPVHGTERNRSNREQRVREAVLLAFCDPLREQCLLLPGLSDREWQKLLIWLDTSGLALYFLDRMIELQLSDMLPSAVLERLQQNLIDNTERTRGMVDESVAIQTGFQDANLSYAVLKGFSLCPVSVPKPELRSQLDLDFLVAERSMPKAREILEQRGYRLRAVSGRSWEFKTDHIPAYSLADLYKNVPLRCVELHVEASTGGGRSLLARAEKRAFHGISMPVLPAADLFLGQGLHLYKHVSSDMGRAAHLIEFRRHILAHSDDDLFWEELRSIAEENPRASLGLGLVTLLIARVMGNFAPDAFTKWTVESLPPFARLWVDMHGRRSVFSSFPGNKLYLLLQRELAPAGVPARRSLRRALMPLRLPPAIAHASANETARARIRRYRLQLRFIFARLRFHGVEGFRYLWELFRWKRQMNRLAQRDAFTLDSFR